MHEWRVEEVWMRTLPEFLSALEQQGWEVFSVFDKGRSEYVQVLYRRKL